MSIRPLTPELAEIARAELNEDPKRIAKDLQHIKDWLAKQPHICARTDDQWLITFLRGCKFSLERTKEKLDLYYSLRSIASELFTVRYDDPIYDELMNLGVYSVLPKTVTAGSPRVIIVRPALYNPEKISLLQFIGFQSIVSKILMVDDDAAIISGIQFIVDIKDHSLAHMMQLTPVLLKKMIVMTQDATPFRMKGTHYINCAPAVVKIIGMIKALLNEKNKKRIFVHSNLDDLYKHIPKSVLPKEYGGDNGSIKDISESWLAKRDQYKPWLEEDLKYKTDESKRPGKPKTSESLFGTEGSFRQIEID